MPETKATIHLPEIQSHGPAVPRDVTRPWPRQVALRDLLRQPTHLRKQRAVKDRSHDG